MSREISLSRGKVAIVDDADYEWLSAFSWSVVGPSDGTRLYARCKIRRNGQRKSVMMHRLIMGEPQSEVDHRDGNKLNNQRSNLRLATHWQNGWNRKVQKNNSSGLKGAFFHKSAKRWHSTITVNKKTFRLGWFPSAEEAHNAYVQAAKVLHGEFAHE